MANTKTTAPGQTITRKGTTKMKAFEWTNMCQEAFEELRHTLHLHHSLVHPNPMKSFPSTWSYPPWLLVQLSSKRRIATPYGEVSLFSNHNSPQA